MGMSGLYSFHGSDLLSRIGSADTKIVFFNLFALTAGCFSVLERSLLLTLGSCLFSNYFEKDPS